ncbi:chromosome partitioning protein ParB [Leptospira langatensis]|uniref:Chromosome partitioning protein ParB n=2 Tax=Leptospira langatensis TaxID=2484983 RepID=A0A5R2ATN3_9LEPT|nr:chromosome partitioning protein ParB [Leptospira langatensis]
MNAEAFFDPKPNIIYLKETFSKDELVHELIHYADWNNFIDRKAELQYRKDATAAGLLIHENLLSLDKDDVPSEYYEDWFWGNAYLKLGKGGSPSALPIPDFTSIENFLQQNQTKCTSSTAAVLALFHHLETEAGYKFRIQHLYEEVLTYGLQDEQDKIDGIINIDFEKSLLPADGNSFFQRIMTSLEKLRWIFKGRGFPLGTSRVWADKKTRIKTADGWKIQKVPKEHGGGQVDPAISKKEEVKPKNKGIEHPSTIPFNQLRRIKQYTDEKDIDREQINTLKERILNEGYDPSFPIMVDKQDGLWTVVAGNHRHIAVEELVQEGKLPDNFPIPVVVKEFASTNERLAAQVAENQRRTVLPTDEATAYGQMVSNGWSTQKIAEKLGKTPGEINKRLALNNLTPDLFQLVKKKDRSLPLGIAEVLGMFATDASGNPNSTIQLRAFKWYVENRSKYPGRGPSVLQSYIKDLQSGEIESFDLNSVATDIQREALRTVSMEKAITNRKMLEIMLDSLSKSYQRILGDNINALQPETVKELAASLAVSSDKGVQSSAVMGRLDVIIRDLSIIKDSISKKMKEIEADAATPFMFAKSELVDFLSDTDYTLNLSYTLWNEYTRNAA